VSVLGMVTARDAVAAPAVRPSSRFYRDAQSERLPYLLVVVNSSKKVRLHRAPYWCLTLVGIRAAHQLPLYFSVRRARLSVCKERNFFLDLTGARTCRRL
jgi:hypothetical protein